MDTDIINFFLGPFLEWLPKVFYGAIFVSAVLLYFFNNKIFNKHSLNSKFFVLVVSVIGFRGLYALMLSWAQYYIWSNQDFTKLLLPPHQSIKYFLFYSWGRFWIGALISIGVTVLFYLFLKLLRRYNSRFLEKEEIMLGFLVALIIGWPNLIIFIPLAFVLTVLYSLVTTVIFKESYTSLYISFILGGIITLIWGNQLVDIFSLTLLRI